ncbi:MAG: MFS transporter, partial [Clostridia bacterium]
MQNKKLSKGKLIQFFSSELAQGLFTGMVANYLLYFFQPKPNSGLPLLIPSKTFLGFLTVVSLITLFTKIIDAVTDPLVANWSDKCKNKNGRRIPFMRWAAIPYGLSCVLVFFAPFGNESVGNAVWVAIMLALYFLFYTIYTIPKRALIPEIIPDSKERVGAYSLSTVFFMGGSGIAYTANMFVGLIKKSGMEAIWAWRIIFIIFGVIGICLLILSAFCIKEKDYLKQTSPPQESFIKSLKLISKNRDFMIATFADLFNYIAMAFFQTAMFYYITFLIGLKDEQTIFVLIPAIVTAIVLFPMIIHVCKKFNKKTPLLIASAMFTILFTAIYFGDVLPLPPLVKGIGMGILIAYPFAAINIIPQAIISDVIQEDTLRTGANREGMYAAAKTFLEKMAYAIAWMIVSIVLAIGAVEGEAVGLQGVKLTGIIAGVFSLLSFVTLLFYNDKKITKSINEKRTLLLATETVSNETV